MEKFQKYLMLLLVTTFSLTFTACGGDDDDEPQPNQGPTSTLIKGKLSFPGDLVITAKDSRNFCKVQFGCFNNNSNSDDTRQDLNMSWEDGALLLYSNNYSYFGSNLKVIYAGSVKSLAEITSLPTPTITNTWNNGKTLFENGGYIIEGTSGGDLYYVRLYISEIIRNAADDKIGVSYEYQFFNPIN